MEKKKKNAARTFLLPHMFLFAVKRRKNAPEKVRKAAKRERRIMFWRFFHIGGRGHVAVDLTAFPRNIPARLQPLQNRQGCTKRLNYHTKEVCAEASASDEI